MSDVPSWLNEDNAKTVAGNKHAQALAKDPRVQAAVIDHAKKEMGIPSSNGSNPDWAKDQESGQRTPSAANDDLVIDEGRKKELEKYHLVLRLMYGVAAILLGAASALSLIKQTDVGLVFFAIYVFFFALLICCFELGLSFSARFIAVNFGFLYSISGRIIFLLFVGFMSYNFAIFGQIAMGVLYFVGLCHILIMCKFPEFEAYIRRKHFYKQ